MKRPPGKCFQNFFCSFCSKSFFPLLLQIPNPKVVIFGTFLKIESKIRKIIKFQNNTKFALVNEFLRNLRQMKDLGLIFQEKFKKLISDHFCSFYSILNIRHIRIFGKVQNIMICFIFQTIIKEKY